MTDVLLTHSYFLRFDPKEHKAMMPYPPLGTLYAASVLRREDFSVSLFDTMLAQSETEIVHSINARKPKIVAIYDDDFNYLTKMCLSRMREAAFVLSRLAKEHGCDVIVHGSDASDHAEQYLANGADVVIIGEGEQTLVEVVRVLRDGNRPSLSSVRGIAFADPDGAIIRTPQREVLKTLDNLPFPAWDLVDVERYRTAWKKHHGYFSMNMVTTRGCPYHCNWCAKPIYGQVYNSRSPENVVDEMLFLKSTYNPDHLWFCDDIFGLKPGWIQQFARLVNERKAHIPFKCLARVDLLLKYDAIHHLAEAGCRIVWVGAESGSQKILDAMEKGTTVEQIHQATAMLRKHNIRVGFFLQFGYPGESRADIEQTLDMVKRCEPDEIGISVSYPLPGTKFYDRVRQQMTDKQNWVDSQDLDLMFAGTYHPDFYRELHRVTHKRFRIWRGHNELKRVFTRKAELTPRGLRNIARMAYDQITLPAAMVRLKRLERPHQITGISSRITFPESGIGAR